MSSKQKYSAADEQALMERVLALRYEPHAFVMFAYPWGQQGTPLAKFTGPRTWQRDYLLELRDHIADNRKREAEGQSPKVYQGTTVSGRGIGKSSLVSWLTHWLMSTAIGSTTIVTANTETQLKTRTWAELGKWITLGINGHWFDVSALSLKPAPWFEETVKSDLSIDTGYYYAQAQLWSEECPDAFAGAHNPHGVQVIFDEASGIPKPIWTVTEGFFTEPELHRYWHVFSNGRQNSGAFFDTHHRDREFWRRRQIDSRTVEGTDKAVYDKIIRQHGEDSDEARVEVKGMFPRAGSKQLIPSDAAERARTCEAKATIYDPLIMGVDVARFGDDASVIAWRRGRDARTMPWEERKGWDTMQLAGRVAALIGQYQPDAVFIDVTGVGGGVVDRVRQLGHNIVEVNFGNSADAPVEGQLVANKRAEMWCRMTHWLKTGGAVPDDTDLSEELTATEFGYNIHNEIQLEPKDAMKRRLGRSPDKADALALTFAAPVALQPRGLDRFRQKRQNFADCDYDPLERD